MIENGFGFWMLEVRIVEAVEHTVWLLVMVAMMKACPLVMMFKMGMQSQITMSNPRLLTTTQLADTTTWFECARVRDTQLPQNLKLQHAQAVLAAVLCVVSCVLCLVSCVLCLVSCVIPTFHLESRSRHPIQRTTDQG